MGLIDADSLIERMKRAYEKRIGEWDLICTVAVIGAEDGISTVERHGHWIKKEETNEEYWHYECSICGEPPLNDNICGEGSMLSFYCPHCGAKMDEVEE